MATPSQPPSGSEPRPSEATAPNYISTISTTTVEPGTLESPVSPSSTNALARFEFEMGRGNEGSKILMVEWDPSSSDSNGQATAQDLDGWVVSWEGKATTFSLSDKDDEGGPKPTKRLYFLIPSDAPVPPTVTISHPPSGRTLITKSMPAIFAPGLGVSTRDAGKRGVLHTIWAKKRLEELQEEIRKELLDNSEGIGLEMAVQEREWIVDHFGLVDPHVPPTAATAASAGRPAPPPTPQSPRSPIGGRLGEKLKGLKLATTPADLSNSPSNLHSRQQQHPLQSFSTPDNAGIAVPSRMAPVGAGTAAVASLDAVIGGGGGNQAPVAPSVVSQSKETEDELFALPMSPRSPEMKTSPFSFLK